MCGLGPLFVDVRVAGRALFGPDTADALHRFDLRENKGEGLFGREAFGEWCDGGLVWDFEARCRRGL